MKIFQYGGRHRAFGTMWLTMWPVTWPTEANENTRVARGTLSAITVGSSNLCTGPKFRAAAPNIVADQNFSVVLDLITCRIAVTIEGVENAYLPRNVDFQYRPKGDIGVAVVAGAIRNASHWLDERITWCPLFGGVLSQVRVQAKEDLLARSWLTNSICD